MRSRGQIIPKDSDIPHKKFLVRIYIGRENGKRRYASALVEGTFKQAERKLTEMLRGTDTDTFVKTTKLTVKSHFESWLSTKNDISPGSKRSYRYRLTMDVYPSLGSTQLQKVTPKVIRSLYAELGKTKAARTIRLTHAALTQGFTQAVTDGLLLRNPTVGCTEAIAKVSKSEGDALTLDEVRTILAVDHKSGLYFRTILETGMRPGEALALRWSDLTSNGLSVSRTVTMDEDDKSYIKDSPKNESSVRVVPISVDLRGELEGHRKEQVKVMLSVGPEYDRAGDLIFATSSGAHITEHNVREQWRRLLKRAGVRAVRLYDSRHTHISWLLQNGENPKVVATRTGHANTKVLLDTYTHVLPGAAERLAETFGDLLKVRA